MQSKGKLPYSSNSTKSENTLVLCLDAIRSPEHRSIGIFILSGWKKSFSFLFFAPAQKES
jgi:hypothetical protein